MAIRILVVEDNQLMRMGIVTLLRTQDDLQLVAEAADGVQAVAAFRAQRPDLVLLDLRLPTLDGVQVTTALRREDPEAKILILSHYDGDEQVFQAVRAGARGYLTKEAPGPEILAAIRAVAGGEQYLPAEVAERLAEHMRQPTLTARERRVLDGLAQGLTNRAIGERLGLSERTIAIFVSNLLWKLGARTRTEAVAVAGKRGLTRLR